jgi:hypothetical protein
MSPENCGKGSTFYLPPHNRWELYLQVHMHTRVRPGPLESVHDGSTSEAQIHIFE